MLILEDSIEIKTTPEELLNWFKNLDKYFVKWHPNHTNFVKLTGGMDEGDEAYFEECIDGKWFKFKFKIVELEKTKKGWIAVMKRPFATIIFSAEAKGENECIFTHIESFGIIKSTNPTTLRVSDAIFRKFFNSIYRFDLIEKDIIEDNTNLKQMMETTGR